MDWGKVKFWVERMSWYPAKASFIVTLLIGVKVYGISEWWLLGIIPLMVGLYYFDRHRVAPGEFSQYMLLNPEWRKIVKQLEDIKNK